MALVFYALKVYGVIAAIALIAVTLRAVYEQYRYEDTLPFDRVDPIDLADVIPFPCEVARYRARRERDLGDAS